MAEQINIKLLIDAAESAKTVAETKKALRDLKTAAMSVEEGSAAFNEINMAAGQLQDRIGDLQATTKYFANDMRKLEGLTGIAEGIAGGFALAQGALQLFGTENKNLEASLTKLTAVMSVLNGLQAVGNVLQKESAASLFVQNTVRKTAIALTSEQAVAEAAEAVAAGTATVAQRALNAAMNANPIGILITLILAGVAALTLWTNKTEKDKKAQEERNKKLEEAKKKQEELDKARKQTIDNVVNETAELGNYLYALRETNAGTEQRKMLIDELNKKYPGIIKNLSDEAAFQQQVNAKIADYIAYQRLRILADINEGKTKKAIAAQQAAIDKIDLLASQGRIKAYTAEQYRLALLGKQKVSDIDFSQDMWIMGGKLDAQQKKTLITLNEAQTTLSSNNAVLEDAAKRELELKTELDKTRKSLGLNTDDTKKNKDANKDNKDAVSDLSEAYRELEENIRTTNENISELALGNAQSSYEKIVKLRQLQNEKTLNDLKSQNAKEEQSWIDKYVADQKALKENAKKTKEQLEEKAKQDAKYNELVVANQKETNLTQKKLNEDLTKFIEEEQLRRAALVEQYTKQILSTPEWKRFLDFSSELSFKIGEIENNLSNTSFGLREVDGQIQKVTTSMVKMGDVVLGGQTVEDVQKVTEAQLAGAKNIIQTSVGESSTAIDLLASIYQGKLEKINEITAKINEDLKLAGEKMTFAIEPVGPDQFGLDQLVNKYEDGALKLSNALEVQYKKLTANEAEVFNKSLFDAYDNYQKKITLAGDNVKERKKVEKEYLDEVEKAQEDHNDRMLLIDVAYGKASTEQMVDNFKSKKEKRDAQNQKTIDQQKKLNEELLALEAQVQQLLLQLFEQYQEKRNRAAQDRYDAEIERIDAEQKKYEDSIANRTASEQAQLDIEAGFDEQRKNAEDNLKIEQNKIAEKAFNAQKANDATTVAIQTAVAIAKTIAELGGVGALTPPGIALIAAVAAQGIAAEALVLTKEFVPQYAEGGLVVGPGSGTSDSINAKLSNGESVINAKSTRMFAPILSAINQAGGGKAIPNLATGGLITTGMTTSTNNDFQELKDAIYSLADRPIETYVKQTVVTNAQDTARKIKNRTTFG